MYKGDNVVTDVTLRGYQLADSESSSEDQARSRNPSLLVPMVKTTMYTAVQL